MKKKGKYVENGGTNEYFTRKRSKKKRGLHIKPYALFYLTYCKKAKHYLPKFVFLFTFATTS